MGHSPSDKVKAPLPDDVWRVLLHRLEQINVNLDFVAAVEACDWKVAGRLLDQGADVLWRNHLGLKALLNDGGMEAAQLLEKCPENVRKEFLFNILAKAAEKGNTDVVDHFLSGAVPAFALNAALFYALRFGHAAIADKLLARLMPDQLNENGFIGLLLWRTEDYQKHLDALPANNTDRHDLVFALRQYMAACFLKKEEAMDIVLRNLQPIAGKIQTQSLLHFELTGYGAFVELTPLVMATGNLHHAEQFTTLFLKAGIPKHFFLREAAAAGNIELVARIIDVVKPDNHDLRYAIIECCFDQRMEALRFFVAHYPEAVKDSAPYYVLSSIVEAGDTAGFHEALDIGISLGEKHNIDELIVKAASKERKEILRFLLQLQPPDGVTASLLRSEGSLPCLKLAAALTEDMRADDDALFWKAVEANDAETLALFEKTKRISTESSLKIKTALDAAAQRGDVPLLRRIAGQAEWHKKSSEIFFNAGLLLPAGALADPAFSAVFPHPGRLAHEQLLRSIGGKGRTDEDAVRNLEFLKKNGTVFTHEDIAHALRSSVTNNTHGITDYLLGEYFRSFDKPEEKKDLDDYAWPGYTLEHNADGKTVKLLRKWTSRLLRGPETKKEIEFLVASCAKDDLFRGAACPALRAAQAGFFSLVLDRMEKEGLSDPAILLQPRDNCGNSLFDILGAQGQLNTVLRSFLWKSDNALQFCQTHVHPSYLEQMDFQRLAAELDRLRLKEKSRNARPRLKKGGPS